MRTRQPTRCCCTPATSFARRGKNLSRSKRGHVSIVTKQLLPQVPARLCAPSQPQTTLLARAEALDTLSAWKDNGVASTLGHLRRKRRGHSVVLRRLGRREERDGGQRPGCRRWPASGGATRSRVRKPRRLLPALRPGKSDGSQRGLRERPSALLV